MKLLRLRKSYQMIVILFAGILFSGFPSGCIIKNDPCLSTHCENGGTCSGGVCVCSSLFTGDRCQTAHDQLWELTFSDGGATPHFQVIQVTIKSFTNSGTFSETSTSPGLWMFDASGTKCFRLTVGGNIVRDSPGDRWSFVGMTGSGCGLQALGSNSSGTANGNFPYATGVTNGTVLITTQSSGGTASGQARWWAVKK